MSYIQSLINDRLINGMTAKFGSNQLKYLTIIKTFKKEKKI